MLARKEQMEVITGRRLRRKEGDEGCKMAINSPWNKGGGRAAGLPGRADFTGETKVTALLIMLKPRHSQQLLLRGHYTRETISLPALL